MKNRYPPSRQKVTCIFADPGSLCPRRLRLGRPFQCLGIFLLLRFAATASLAETEVLYPLAEGYIQGGNQAEMVMDGKNRLMVAARSQATKDNTRKIFLLFKTSSRSDAVNSAKLILTRSQEVARESDAKVPIDLLLLGAPGGDWTGPSLTWSSAPFHSPDSFSDRDTSGLELLAQISVDTSGGEKFAPVEFSDPRLTKFLRKNPGRVTLIVTSGSASTSPGLWFMGTLGTTKPERRPQLVLEMK